MNSLWGSSNSSGSGGGSSAREKKDKIVRISGGQPETRFSNPFAATPSVNSNASASQGGWLGSASFSSWRHSKKLSREFSDLPPERNNSKGSQHSNQLGTASISSKGVIRASTLNLNFHKFNLDRQSRATRGSRQSGSVGEDGEIYEDSDDEQLMLGVIPGRKTAVAKGSKRLSTIGLSKLDPWRVRISRSIVNDKSFIAFTTLLTVYALIGDDIKLAATDKPADVVFNVLTCVCLAVFTFEIIVSCFGKNDYILGFFMCLDVVSTATLILDLSYFSDAMMSGDEGNQMRSGRTARVGAKAGRVVRVIRLVRILKLYKAIYEHAAQLRKEREEDEWGDIDTVNPHDRVQGIQESRVGKKLSEMTTRRVILLVLTMLIVLPFLRTQGEYNIPSSAFYGADEVHLAWTELLEQPKQHDSRERYEEAMLKYMYYHNWFNEKCKTDYDYACPSWYYSHVFWIGITSAEKSTVDEIVTNVTLGPPFTRLRLETVQRWNRDASEQHDMYNFGTMPNAVLPIMAGEWTSSCTEEDRGIFRRGLSLLEKEIDGAVSYAAPCPSDLRTVERAKFFPRIISDDMYSEWHFTFYFDTRLFTRSEAMFGLIITAFICVVLCVAALSFSSDANKLVLQPVEAMVKRVQSIRENPLIAMRMADDEFKLEEKQRAKQEARGTTWRAILSERLHQARCIRKETEPMETAVLEKTIIKLGSLLALGFGEAGANIIGENLANSDSAGINVMIPGKCVECVIGKARINNFSTATEVLQERVMAFVNQIAEIVHGVVNENWGAANKNSGETFLVIWRTTGLDAMTKMKYADMSMSAVAKILGAVHRASFLVAYRKHPGLQQRLGTRSKVSLTFGLHAGWAIEGAVGSEFKIDTSYLSPNVSIASSIESATKIYSVPILVTEAVIKLGSTAMTSKCRMIDRVDLKGSKVPLSLYSMDLDYECVSAEHYRAPAFAFTTRMRFKTRQFLEAEKQSRIQPDFKIYHEFDRNGTIQKMRKRYTMEFLQLFHMGFANYSHGEWEVAKRVLLDAHAMLLAHGVDDGPCRAILRFMETPYGFKAPEGWTGIREL